MKGDCVVQAIQIENFRSLKNTGLQKLSPITILVGENSSGKSTFLRAFPLLKQSISKRTSGPILWAGDTDDYVDFGSFEETVTNDGADSISFRFNFELSNPARRYFNRLERLMDPVATTDTIDYQIIISSEKSVKEFILSINSMQIRFDISGRCVTVDNDFSYSEEPPKDKAFLADWRTMSRLGPFRGDSEAFGFSLPNISVLWTKLNDSISVGTEEQRDYYFNDAIIDLGHRLSLNNNIQYLNNSDVKATNSRNQSRFENVYNQALDQIRDNNDLQGAIKLCYAYAIFPQIEDYVMQYFKQVHYIAPLRATAERYYRLRNLAVDEVDYQGKNLAIFINSLTTKQLKEFNDWTNTHFGFAVSTDKSKGHLSLLVRLKNSSKAINLSDTGFGYSQVLPIITQLWELSSRKKAKSNYSEKKNLPLVIAIEQPELHLHPAVQAKLAKAFIASVSLAKANGYQMQILIETHSDTIVNCLGKSIAKGELSAEAVSVILFDKKPDSNLTTVSNSNYDSDGYLVNWPYGFFEPEE